MAKKNTHRRLTASESKAEILDATLKLLPKNGWTRTSFQMVANHCHTSQSNVLYHFKTKETLLKALLEKISQNNFDQVAKAMRPDFDAFKRLCVHFEKNLEWAVKFPEEAQVIIFVYSEATHLREFSFIFKEILDRAQGRILEYVLAGIREKIFYPSIDPHILAKILHNVLVGKFINLVSGREAGVRNYQEREWKEVISGLTGYKKGSVKL